MGIVRAKYAGDMYTIMRNTSRIETPRLTIFSAINKNLSKYRTAVSEPTEIKKI